MTARIHTQLVSLSVLLGPHYSRGKKPPPPRRLTRSTPKHSPAFTNEDEAEEPPEHLLIVQLKTMFFYDSLLSMLIRRLLTLLALLCAIKSFQSPAVTFPERRRRSRPSLHVPSSRVIHNRICKYFRLHYGCSSLYKVGVVITILIAHHVNSA